VRYSVESLEQTKIIWVTSVCIYTFKLDAKEETNDRKIFCSVFISRSLFLCLTPFFFLEHSSHWRIKSEVRQQMFITLAVAMEVYTLIFTQNKTLLMPKQFGKEKLFLTLFYFN
jgi:hypothetical protein